MDTVKQNAKRKDTPDVYKIISDRIIEQLRKGIVPWRVLSTDAGIPTSLISQKPYRGINVMLLATLGYERNLFITEKQLGEIGAAIKPNERPHMITYYNFTNRETKGAAEDGKQKAPVLRYYMVYNVSQCVGVPDTLLSVNASRSHLCEKIVEDMLDGPTIRHKDPAALYDPLEDYVNMPKLKSFESPAEYYQILFHQLVHSTGHHTRLDRMGLVQMAEYGANPFSMEELVAEIGTAYLESFTGIAVKSEPRPEYLQGWISRLQKDTHFIFTAATLAQKAVDFILNAKTEEEPAKEEVEEMVMN